MKKIHLVTCAILVLILSQCTQEKTTAFDPEKEKALIMELLERNNSVLINRNKDDIVHFMRKYNVAKAYAMNNDSLVIINLPDSSDQEIFDMFASGPYRIISMDQYYPPVIKVFSDGRSGYCIGKYLTTLKRDSSDVEIIKKASISFISIVEKPDSIWIMGDFMQNIKSIR